MHMNTRKTKAAAPEAPEPARSLGQKKPSGHQGRVARRNKKAKIEANQAKRDEQIAERAARGKVNPVGAARAHLQLLELLMQQACDIANDDVLAEEDRRKQLNDTAHAMGKISANAECEREADELKAIVDQRVDELKAKKRALQVAAKKHTCVECGRKMTD